MTTIGVVVATFGDADVWVPLAARAAASAHAQTRPPDDVVCVHGFALHEARNAGAAELDTEWIVFLDADDSLDAGYLAAMEAAIARLGDGEHLLQPATLGVYPDGREDSHPVLIPPKASLLDGNHLVIGTAVRRDLFQRVGGFRDWPLYEDWCVWIRCWLEGAVPVGVPAAVYRVTVREGSRNNAARALQVRTYNAIRGNYLEVARRRGVA
jgi:glycosyltransferase involved in cell wall biosynthesis